MSITTESESRNRLATGQSRSQTDCNQTQSRSGNVHITLWMKLQLSCSHHSDVSSFCFEEAWKLSLPCCLFSFSNTINDFSMTCCKASAPDPADVMIQFGPWRAQQCSVEFRGRPLDRRESSPFGSRYRAFNTTGGGKLCKIHPAHFQSR